MQTSLETRLDTSLPGSNHQHRPKCKAVVCIKVGDAMLGKKNIIFRDILYI
jgi:hypothetical protein